MNLLSKVNEPCSDLWRRMFIWFDGKINPCDTDYKTKLKVGQIQKDSISTVWQGENYKNLRQMHQNGKRNNVKPCNRCIVL